MTLLTCESDAVALTFSATIGKKAYLLVFLQCIQDICQEVEIVYSVL